MAQKKQNKTTLLLAALLLVAVLAFALLYGVFSPQPAEGAKTIQIQVVDNKQQITDYQTHTDAAYLRQALEETDGLTFSGTEGPYGLMIETVNGVTAYWEQNQAWWSIYVNDELASYGADSQPVADGDRFRLQYTTEADAAR